MLTIYSLQVAHLVQAVDITELVTTVKQGETLISFQTSFFLNVCIQLFAFGPLGSLVERLIFPVL